MKDYIEKALRTKSPTTEVLQNRLVDSVDDIHALLGIATELGELADPYKKWIYYGRLKDRVNAIEELGDLFWYIAILCHQLGTTFEEVQRINIDKLRARYPDKFTEENANERDLDAERETLEDWHRVDLELPALFPSDDPMVKMRSYPVEMQFGSHRKHGHLYLTESGKLEWADMDRFVTYKVSKWRYLLMET